MLKMLDFPASSKSQSPYKSWRNLGLIIRRCFFVWVHPATLILFTFIPIACFSIFGLGQEYSNIDLGETTISGSIMCNMCQYSVVFVAACITARIGTEQATGWTRQIALTPITSRLYGTGRVIATAISCLAMTIITYSYGCTHERKGSNIIPRCFSDFHTFWSGIWIINRSAHPLRCGARSSWRWLVTNRYFFGNVYSFRTDGRVCPKTG